MKYIIITIFFFSPIVKANIVLPSIFSSNMVLQQSSVVKMWGWADPGEVVEIIPGWNNAFVKTSANQNGSWMVDIKTPQSGKSYEITYKGKNTIVLTNVVLGEVWLCSGQSNMDFPIIKTSVSWQNGVLSYEEEVKHADYPGIRLFHVARHESDTVQKNCSGEWKVCIPENAGTFSAAAYYFGRYLHNKLNVPIGLIQSSVGGTHAELWTKREVLDDTVYNTFWKVYWEGLEKYTKHKESKDTSLKVVHKSYTPSCLWNGMISPLIPFKIQGVIWYQGEANDTRNDRYSRVFANLIDNWRKEWNQGDFPFYFVQIAPYKDRTPELREAQLQTWKSVSNTGMVVVTDAGDSTNIHPRNKQVVGERLALWALANDYGFKDIQYSGPIYKSMKIEKNSIRLMFDYADHGLESKDGALKEFTIAGQDKIFYPAEAVIDGATIVMHSKNVKNPIAVRYAWKNFMHPNLYNKDGLPASPFRTDDWK
jgi:sialate O-acetylesterase